MFNAGLIPSTVYAFRACCKVPSSQALNLITSRNSEAPQPRPRVFGSKRQYRQRLAGPGFGGIRDALAGDFGCMALGHTVLYQLGDAFR